MKIITLKTSDKISYCAYIFIYGYQTLATLLYMAIYFLRVDFRVNPFFSILRANSINFK